MIIIVTPRELLDKGGDSWYRVCDLKGISEWAVNEGQMDDDEAIVLTIDEAKKLGLIGEIVKESK